MFDDEFFKCERNCTTVILSAPRAFVSFDTQNMKILKIGIIGAAILVLFSSLFRNLIYVVEINKKI